MGLPSGAGAFIGLTIIAIILLCVIMGLFAIFGKKWDWYSRHTLSGGDIEDTILP